QVKFAELTLDTFRMLQCLEWEPSGSFYQKNLADSISNGGMTENSLTSGMIDINLLADMTDPNLPPNPKKAIMYRPSMAQLLSAIATASQELQPDRVLLIYVSAPGNAISSSPSEVNNTGTFRKSSRLSAPLKNHHDDRNGGGCENRLNTKRVSNQYYENYLTLGPGKNGGSSVFFPGDIIPFTRRPLFLIVDSDSSHVFKAAELVEPISLFLSPSRPSYKNRSVVSDVQIGSQFTFFLTAPLLAFCQLVDYDMAGDHHHLEKFNGMEQIVSSAFSKWEEILCTSLDLDIAWAQLLRDPFLRRLLLRYLLLISI
ncbi:hypothetical protein M569_16609, partial [Genlisea aurea]